MAMAWITGIFNRSSSDFSLYQNDPTYHPVINGHQYRPDERIGVPQGVSYQAYWFVIPWLTAGPNGYGRLGLVKEPERGKRCLEYFVTTGSGRNNTDINEDYIRVRDADVRIEAEVHLGPKGGAPAGGSADFHLILRDTGPELQLVAHQGPIDIGAIAAAVKQVADLVLPILFP